MSKCPYCKKSLDDDTPPICYLRQLLEYLGFKKYKKKL